MLPTFCNDTVKVLRSSLTSSGRRERDWSAATETTVGGCSVQPSTTSGDTVDRESTSETLECYMPPGTDVRATDRVEWMGRAYAVVGEPRLNRSPFGRADNVQVTIKRWAG